MKNESEKIVFSNLLKEFAGTLAERISFGGEWTIRGFIDVFKNIYPISSDTKLVSKLLELHLFPILAQFAEETGYVVELAERQNWYPDMTFIKRSNPAVKFAVDLKTTYRLTSRPDFCNGFTLGSHGEYFVNRSSKKNIQYPYNAYCGHFCLGVIYTRSKPELLDETKRYTIDSIERIPAVAQNFLFFAEEKWRIASDKSGSGNTANIGSIHMIDDILAGNGVFARAGEEFFDDYWANFGKMEVPDAAGQYKKLSSFADYLRYRGLPQTLNNARALKRI